MDDGGPVTTQPKVYIQAKTTFFRYYQTEAEKERMENETYYSTVRQDLRSKAILDHPVENITLYRFNLVLLDVGEIRNRKKRTGGQDNCWKE
jgi:hypothetical protein